MAFVVLASGVLTLDMLAYLFCYRYRTLPSWLYGTIQDPTLGVGYHVSIQTKECAHEIQAFQIRGLIGHFYQ